MPENNENKKEKKSKFSLRKLIYNDKYLIIFSILAAVVVWIAASMNLSPETTKTITVPVNVDFSDSAAEHLGLKCYGDETIDVDVTVSCKKYLAKDITADDINVILQTNTVTTKGNSEVPIKVEAAGENNDFNITSYYPTVYKAYFDVEAQKTMDINVSYENKDFIAEGYIMGEPLLSENTAVVSGPKSYVSQVKKLVSTVSIDDNIKSTQSIDLTVIPVDSSGSTVDYVSVNTGSNNLTLTIPVLKEMTLNVTSSFINKPESLDVSDFVITYSKDTVNAGVLEDAGISEANIGDIDFSKLKPGLNTFKFDVSSLENMVILEDISEITVNVRVPSSYDQKSVKIDKASVTVANIPEGYDAVVTSISSNSVTVVGKENSLNTDSLGVGLVVDLSAYENNISTGSSDYTLTTSLENSKNCWVYGDYTARVTITKK
ncbi:MAG: YbbR-like domain-containing protein [Eubacterium sp.]